MAILTTGTIGLAATFKVAYAKDLLMEAEPNLLHATFGTKGRIAGGKTVEIRKFAALPTKTGVLTEGVTPLPDTLEVTKIEATAEQVGAYVITSDLLLETAYDPIQAETARLQGDQAGRTYDYRIRDVLSQGTSVRYVNRSSRATFQASDVLSSIEVKKTIRTLRNNNARPFPELGNCFAGLIDPSTEFDLINDAEWKAMVQNNEALADRFQGHYLGRCWGVEWFRSTAAKLFVGAGVGGIDVHSTLIIGQGAYGVYTLQDLEWIMKPLGSGGTEDALNQRASMGWKGSFIAKILFDAYMVRIEHAVSQ